MTPPTFTPGRYVRSQLEAERIAAEYPAVVKAMRGQVDTHPREQRLAALIAIELVRRGYVFDWMDCIWRVLPLGLPLDDLRPSPDRAIAIVDTWQKFASVTLTPEEHRDELVIAWDAIAPAIDGDDTELIDTTGRPQNQLRWWGMRNLAMRAHLEKGECVDLSACQRTALDDYIVPPDVWQEDVDYCDAQTESWIWSIGKRLADDPSIPAGTIIASRSTQLYQNPLYHCLWLR
jgi:hypothetical protein